MEIKYVKGNLIEALPYWSGKKVIVPHIVNNVGKFGSGFAAAVMKTYPIVRSEYIDWIGYIMGAVQFVKINDNLQFANMVGQMGTIGPKNPKPIKYLALANAMELVAKEFPRRYEEIVCPKFGSGLANGNWEFIEELIEEIWIERNIIVTVYYLE